MRGAKQQHGWKLDDERRKRSPQAATTTSVHNDNHPGNYMHEKKRTGIDVSLTDNRLYRCQLI